MIQETTQPTKIRLLRLFKRHFFLSLLCAFFCILPGRFLAAALLFLFLVIFLMVVNKASPTAVAEQAPPYSEVRLAEDMEEQKKTVVSSSSIAKGRQIQSVLRLVEKEPGFGMHFSKSRLRSKNEMNDEFLEERIRTLFEDIREVNDIRYRKGLLEIQHLLELRQKSLKGLTPTNKMS